MHRLKKSDVHLERKQAVFYHFDVIRCTLSINSDGALEHEFTEDCGSSAV